MVMAPSGAGIKPGGGGGGINEAFGSDFGKSVAEVRLSAPPPGIIIIIGGGGGGGHGAAGGGGAINELAGGGGIGGGGIGADSSPAPVIFVVDRSAISASFSLSDVPFGSDRCNVRISRLLLSNIFCRFFNSVSFCLRTCRKC